MYKIMHEGKEYQDCVHINTTVNPTLWQRVKSLFHPEIKITTELYSQTVVVDHKVKVEMISYSYWDLFVRWWRIKFGKNKGMMTFNPTIINHQEKVIEHNLQKQKATTSGDN